jgi:hypothetical protein
MHRSALRPINLALSAAAVGAASFGYSAPLFAQDAPATDAPAAEAPAAPPTPAEPVAAAEPTAEPAPVEPVPVEPAMEPAADKPKPPPYSLPWQLRPVVAGNVVRSDTAFAFYKNPANKESGTTVASMLLFSYKVIDGLAPLVRLGVVSNSPPDGTKVGMTDVDLKSSTGFLSPVIGATYAPKLGPNFKLGLFLGVTVPVGSGGGDDAKPEARAANGAGILARSAMDNAMFAVNDFVIFPGVGFAYTKAGFTAQAEVTVLQLTQVRGGTQAQADDSRTNFTSGVHLGYFIVPMLSIGGDLRYQRWLSTPKAVELDEAAADDLQNGLRDTATFAVGPRFHFKLSDSVWFRPGVAFAMPFDKPMSKSKYKIVQLDLPLAF